MVNIKKRKETDTINWINMKKLTVTIFIPAHNEAHNLPRLLDDLLKQKQDIFTCNRILVVSDGSTDNTEDIVRTVDHPSVQLIRHAKRLGEVARINQVFSKISTDILIQIDADVRMKRTYTLEALIKPFLLDRTIQIVCGNHKPLAPVTFIEKLGYFGATVWNRALDSLGDAAIGYRCVGHIRAFRKNFYRNFSLPLIAGSAEDTYSFYSAMKRNAKVVFAPNALVEHRLPNTMYDYIKQMRRFLNERSILVNAFGESLVRKHETMTTKVKLRALINESFRASPLVVGAYIILQLIFHILPKQHSPTNGIWEVSVSTKKT